MLKNETIVLIVFILSVLSIAICAVLTEYKVRLAHIEAGYILNEENKWEQSKRCNCPQNTLLRAENAADNKNNP